MRGNSVWPSSLHRRQARELRQRHARPAARCARGWRCTARRLLLVTADVGQHLAVVGADELDAAAAEHRVLPAQRDHALHPLQQRRRRALLRLDVDRLVAVDRVHDDGEVEPGRIGAREAGIAVAAPLHRRAHAVAIAEVDVVAHADLVAVVDDRRPRHREQQAVHQLDARRGCSPSAAPAGGGCRG